MEPRGVARRVPVLNGYPPTLRIKFPGTREYLRPFWAGIRVPVQQPNTHQAPGARILGEHEAPLVSVSGIGKPRITRGCADN